ncbi:hypothetical protein [Crossiella cryophila]|uniref:Uncharacterized protein n=1 Tax=Crossiella cryophila TaxID=43355 RepID=A0A7W7CA94_9PSEU|nr:hypothetical protein [Crossiella cryophila]MBB4677428.1 hypothetical protein [Crossiella cryophila]
MLNWIAAAARVVAVHPFPIDLDEGQHKDSTVLEPAMEQIRRTWASLGFEPFDDTIWIMDPNMAAHGNAVKSIADQLGLR